MPAWVWSHDPEAYAYANYDKAVAANKQVASDTENDGMPPNFPPGYLYEKWSIEKVMEDMKNGIPIDLGGGNWD